jgi:ligand-binding sensor protein
MEIPLPRHNFCSLCEKIIRQDPVGELECEENDSEICRMLMDGTAMVPCRSIGLMHAGAPIVVEGKLLATWLIGQVRSETSDDTALRNYISRLNLNEEEALAAYREIPFLPSEKFSAIVQLY